MSKSNRWGAAFAVVFWTVVFGAMLIYRVVNYEPVPACAKGDLYCLENGQ